MDVDAVTPRVLHERMRRVEPHWLGVEESRTERRRVIALEPRAGVHEVGEAHRVALGKAVVGEGRELVPHQVGGLPHDAALGHAVVEPLTDALHALAAALRRHRLAQLVGFAWREPGDGDGDLHELLLEQRHTQRLFQHRLEQRM